MKAIETNALISKDRILSLQLQLPRDVQPGQHHILVVIGAKTLELKTPTETPQIPYVWKESRIPSQVLSSKPQTATDIHAAIVAYATRHAGTKMDLDYELEDAGIECLNAAEERTK